MSGLVSWVHDGNAALLTDLYELTMAQAYLEESLNDEAVFSLFVRRLPPARNFLLACGLEDVLRFLERFTFSRESVADLRSLGRFSERFLDFLAEVRFTGDVHALPEGTPFFPGEPLLEVAAPLPEAQLVETFVLNQCHFQTVLASKAARVVAAARGRPIVDFGLRRQPGTDGGLKAARAFYLAGAASTSNVLAGQLYSIPVAGTMAHSYVQAHDDELQAFAAWVRTYPETILLVDTYDTLEGVRNVIRLAERLGPDFRVRGVRLDSGDLLVLSRQTRRMLDQAGLARVQIFASGGLDENGIAGLLDAGAPIDAFGVGTALGVSEDAPSLDMAYKLVSYAGRGRIKLSPGKALLPGRKQVFRVEREGRAAQDVLACHDEALAGRPLMRPVMRGGRRLEEGGRALEEARARAQRELALLPDALLRLERADPAYRVELSPALAALRDRIGRAAIRKPEGC